MQRLGTKKWIDVHRGIDYRLCAFIQRFSLVPGKPEITVGQIKMFWFFLLLHSTDSIDSFPSLCLTAISVLGVIRTTVSGAAKVTCWSTKQSTQLWQCDSLLFSKQKQNAPWWMWFCPSPVYQSEYHMTDTCTETLSSPVEPHTCSKTRTAKGVSEKPPLLNCWHNTQKSCDNTL